MLRSQANEVAEEFDPREENDLPRPAASGQQAVGLPIPDLPQAAGASATGSGRIGRPDYIYHRLLAGSDILSIVLAAFLASLVTGALGRSSDLESVLPTLLIMVPVWLLMAYGAGLYHEAERRIDYSYVDEIGRIVAVSTAWAWVFALVRSLVVDGGTDQFTLALIWLLMMPILLSGRALVRGHARRSAWNRRPVAVIGDEVEVRALMARIARHPEWGLEVRLKVVPESGTTNFLVPDGHGVPVFDSYDFAEGHRSDGGTPGQSTIRGRRELAQFLDRLGLERAVLAGGAQSLFSKTRITHELIAVGIAVDQVSGGAETLYSRAVLHHVERNPSAAVAGGSLWAILAVQAQELSGEVLRRNRVSFDCIRSQSRGEDDVPWVYGLNCWIDALE